MAENGGIRNSDLGLWGGVALLCGALAVMMANLSGLLPDSTLLALHASPRQGATVGQLRAQIVALEDEAARVRSEGVQLQARLMLAQDAQNDMQRRMGAIEGTIPAMLEALPRNGVDLSAVTASTGERPETVEVEGGSVAVSHVAMTAPVVPGQQIPAPLPAIAP